MDSSDFLTDHIVTDFLSNTIYDILNFDASKRPTAEALCELFNQPLHSPEISAGSTLEPSEPFKSSMQGSVSNEGIMLNMKCC